MVLPRPAAAEAPPSLEVRLARLDALSTRSLAARCLEGLAELEEVILGPKARHGERLLAALLDARVGAPGELLEARRELAARCQALAALQREHLACAEERLARERALAELEARLAALPEESAPAAPEEEDALQQGTHALEQIEAELAGLRAERERLGAELERARREADWRAGEMRAAAAGLAGLRFRLLAPELAARAQGWSGGPP